MSVLLGPLVCGAHPVWLVAWVFAGTLHTLAVNAGLGAGDEGFHDLHHEKFSCNYGTPGVARGALSDQYGIERWRARCERLS